MCCSGNLRPPTQTSLITLLEYLHSGHDRGFGQQLEILRSILLLNGVLPTRSSQSMHPLRSDADDFSLLKEESCNYDCSCMDIIQSLLWAFPKLAWTRREKDRALPLHIAALIGNLNLARILAAAVSIILTSRFFQSRLSFSLICCSAVSRSFVSTKRQGKDTTPFRSERRSQRNGTNVSSTEPDFGNDYNNQAEITASFCCC